MSIVGSTGLNLVEYAHPTLTVLQQPMEEMGREAALMLLEMVREEIRRLLGRFLPSPFIVRESLAAPVPAQTSILEKSHVTRGSPGGNGT